MTRRTLFQMIPLVGALPAAASLPKLPALDPLIVTSTASSTWTGPPLTYWCFTDEQLRDFPADQLTRGVLDQKLREMILLRDPAARQPMGVLLGKTGRRLA